MGTKGKAPAMSADDARRFDGHSLQNMAYLLTLLDCSCEPYSDVFTYRRWKAQGYQVQRGEKAYRLPLIFTVDRENKETGETVTERRRGTSCVFCRCQVKPIEGRSAA